MLKLKCNTNFQDIWLENEEYKPWLQKVGNNLHVSRCKACSKDINIDAYDITPLNTHAKGFKLKEHLPKVGSQSFFKNNIETEGSGSAKQQESSCKQSSIDSCTNRTLVINAEIKWVLDVAISKYSFNSGSNENELFTIIFSDSKVAKTFSFG